MDTDFIHSLLDDLKRIGYCISGIFFVWIELGMDIVAYIDQTTLPTNFESDSTLLSYSKRLHRSCQTSMPSQHPRCDKDCSLTGTEKFSTDECS
jgi:hypothetical protein